MVIGVPIQGCLADHPPAEGLPLPGRDSPIDSVDDFFRIRLVCALLDTCGSCFDRGAQKRKLDLFLVVLQVCHSTDMLGV